jgi:hypothetical protein
MLPAIRENRQRWLFKTDHFSFCTGRRLTEDRANVRTRGADVRPAVAAGTQQAVRGQNVPVHDMCGVHYFLLIVQSMRRHHVRYWHKADMPSCAAHARFRGIKRTSQIVWIRRRYHGNYCFDDWTDWYRSGPLAGSCRLISSINHAYSSNKSQEQVLVRSLSGVRQAALMSAR